MKQLLVILNLLFLSLGLCPLGSQVSGVALYPITMVNLQLNATVADYPVAVAGNDGYSFAVAVTQMEVMAQNQWNVTVAGNATSVVVTLRSAFVNWVKISCLLWGSNRADLLLGSANFATSTSASIGTTGSTSPSDTSTQTVPLNQQLTSPESSLAMVFINGFKMTGNGSLVVKVVPFKVDKNSFAVNITNGGCTLSSIIISYVVFSPSLAAYQVYGDTFFATVQQSSSFDLSQQIPNTFVKVWGFSSLSLQNGSGLQLQTVIDSDYVLTVTSSNRIDFTLQYLYLLPQVYSCPASCNASIVYNNSCVQSCPVGTLSTSNGDISYCRSCSSKLGQTVDVNGTSCVCKDGYFKNGTSDVCLPVVDSNTVSNASTSSNTTANNSSNNTSKNSTGQMQNTSSLASNTTSSTNISSSNATNSTSSSNNTNNSTNTHNGTNSTTNSRSPNASNPANSTNSSTSSNLTNCSKTSNSMLINGKCLCLVGYVNLSNTCIPLVSLGNPYQTTAPSTSSPAIKASSACLENQEFSISLNRCICMAGFQLNSSKCVSVCSSVESYDNPSGSCRCIAGYSRVNSVCNFCVAGNPNCYILTKTYCRNDFVLISGTCVSCSLVSLSNRINSSCSLCSQGYVYNGYACVCPTAVVNQTCVLPSCGNKRIDAGETCDDGNAINGDGCSSLCIIQMNFYCSGLPSLCQRTVCGNGVITGGQECDDGNTSPNDGCSSICLQQPNYTCVGSPSLCFNITTGNLTLITINQTTNNVYVIFQTPRVYSFPNPAFMQSFLTYKILKQNQTAAMIYCQQQLLKLNRFDCLLIFPSGVPLSDFVVQFGYNYQGTTGSSIVNFKHAQKSGNN